MGRPQEYGGDSKTIFSELNEMIDQVSDLITGLDLPHYIEDTGEGGTHDILHDHAQNLQRNLQFSRQTLKNSNPKNFYNKIISGLERTGLTNTEICAEILRANFSVLHFEILNALRHDYCNLG